MEGLDREFDVWMDGTAFCNALEPLLRLAAQKPGLFSDATGAELPEVRSAVSCCSCPQGPQFLGHHMSPLTAIV